MCRPLGSWILEVGGWSKTATVSLYFIFPGICTLSLIDGKDFNSSNLEGQQPQVKAILEVRPSPLSSPLRWKRDESSWRE
ncbi:hypothetical protein STEG23_007106 [Scotinomys teguina]